jgi:hypothetical protein
MIVPRDIQHSMKNCFYSQESNIFATKKDKKRGVLDDCLPALKRPSSTLWLDISVSPSFFYFPNYLLIVMQ